MSHYTVKQSVRDLAILGGKPAFYEPLHVGRPNIGNTERLFQRIQDALERRWLTNNGPFVQEFEKRLAQFLQVKHVIAMTNATIALEIVTRALGLTGEVIVPSFTFIATAHALQWQKITPVFCDIDPRTHNIDPPKVEALITSKTTGIIGVHVWGRPCNIDALTDISNRYGLKLVFDAAHAFGSSYKGKMIGTFGEAEVFSFHATKFFNTFEGGAVATNNDELAEKLRLMRNFGFAGRDKVIYIGTNGKMHEITAAMGLTSLESLDEFIEVNRRNYYSYHRELDNIPGITQIYYDENEKNNYQYIILEVDESEAGITRDQLMEILWAENVLARRYFYPGCHEMEPYRTLFPEAETWLPETKALTRRVLSLPTGTSVDAEKIRVIGSIIRMAVENSEMLRKFFDEG